MESILDELSDEYDSRVKICQINIDDNRALAAEIGVEVVPTFAVFKWGKPVAAASGILSKNVLVDMIKT